MTDSASMSAEPKAAESGIAGVPSTAPDAPDRRSAVFGGVVIVVGLLLALWICFGRFLFGIGGSLTPIYVVTIGFLVATLHFFAGRAIGRTARLGRRTRPATIAMICVAWGCGILLGLMIPDATADGLQTILSGATEPGLGIAIGVANPLGIICLATSIAALVLAHGDATGRTEIDED